MKVLKEYLTDVFRYNELTNRKLLEQMGKLKDKSHSVRHFSNIILSHQEWLSRVTHQVSYKDVVTHTQTYSFTELEHQWVNAIQTWLIYIENKCDNELNEYIDYTCTRDGHCRARVRDIVTQISIDAEYHRSRITSLLHAEGIQPEAAPYIGTVRKLV
jgi:uncharacterized damage-inducible protein DinB